MINKYHILPYFYGNDWDGLIRFLSQLTNRDFHKMEKTVREEILPTLQPQSFWPAMQALLLFKKSAFVTGIAALQTVATKEGFSFKSDEAQAFARVMIEQMPEVPAKIINIALPLMQTEEQIEDLFDLFEVDNMRDRLASLLKVESPLTYFVMFKVLKMIPDNQELGRKCCIYIMKRNNDLSFNMASILRAYFDLQDLKSQLSLKIDTYELNYIDRNYEAFLHVLNGKRPKI